MAPHFAYRVPRYSQNVRMSCAMFLSLKAFGADLCVSAVHYGVRPHFRGDLSASRRPSPAPTTRSDVTSPAKSSMKHTDK